MFSFKIRTMQSDSVTKPWNLMKTMLMHFVTEPRLIYLMNSTMKVSSFNFTTNSDVPNFYIYTTL